MCGDGGLTAPVIRRKSSRNFLRSRVSSTSITTAIIGVVVENEMHLFLTRRGSALLRGTYSAAASQEAADCGLQTVRWG